MVKKIICIIFLVCLSGCTYEGKNLKTYFENPRSLIQDPHFADYKEKRDKLERQYLNKEISYADYVRKMDELDEQYSKEVQERDSKVISSPY